ncbi:hypothetical protein D9M71_713560 [compost metagenome]
MAQDRVLLFFFTELVCVEGDVLEHALAGILEFGAVSFLNSVQRLVNSLTVSWLMATLVEGIEAGVT